MGNPVLDQLDEGKSVQGGIVSVTLITHTMPRMSQVLREHAFGMLTTVMSTKAVARELIVNFSTISLLQCGFREFGSMFNRLHNRKSRVWRHAVC